MRPHLASRLGWAFSLSLSTRRSRSFLFQLVSDQPFFSLFYSFRPPLLLLFFPSWSIFRSLSFLSLSLPAFFFCLRERERERSESSVQLRVQKHLHHPRLLHPFFWLSFSQRCAYSDGRPRDYSVRERRRSWYISLSPPPLPLLLLLPNEPTQKNQEDAHTQKQQRNSETTPMNDDDDDDDVSKNSLFNRVYLALKMRWRPPIFFSLSPVQKYIHQKCDNRRRRRRRRRGEERESLLVKLKRRKAARTAAAAEKRERKVDLWILLRFIFYIAALVWVKLITKSPVTPP